MMAMGTAPGQHDVQAIALPEVIRAVQAAQRAAGPQVELKIRAPRRVQPQATGGHPRLGTAARFQLNPEPHAPVQDHRRPDQLAPATGNIIGQVSTGTQREGIGEPDQASRTAQLDDQHAGVRLVALPGLRQPVRGNREITAAIAIQQTAEDRLGIETGKAQPADAAIQPDQGRSGPVSDQPEILKWRVILADPDKPEGRIGIEHDADIPSQMSALAIMASIIRTHRNYIAQTSQPHPAPSRSSRRRWPRRASTSRLRQWPGLSPSRAGRRRPLFPPSLFEHPAAELSVDDSAQLSEDHRQSDHIA
jgi:hypothetical protein